MKKTVFKGILIYLVALIVGYGAGFLMTNYRAIVSKNTNASTISDYSFKQKNNTATLSFNHDNEYIRLLSFDYTANTDFSWQINYDNADGEPVSLSGKSNSEAANLFSKKINDRVGKATISFKPLDKNHSFSLDISQLTVDNRLLYIGWHFYVTLAVSLTVATLFFFRKKLFEHPERTFLILAIPAFVCTLLIQPFGIGKVGDDETHFSRVYLALNDRHSHAAQVFDSPFGKSESPSNDTEAESYNHIDLLNQERFSESGLKFNLSFESLAYPGMICGEFIGTILGLGFSTTIYLALLLNIAVYIAVMYFAIKKLPIGKYILMVVALIPAAIYLTTNFSYDPTVLAFLSLGFSYMLAELLSRDNIQPKNIIVIIVSMLFVSAAKPPYLVMFAPLFFLAKKKFVSLKQCRAFKILFALLIITLAARVAVNSVVSGNILADTRGGNVGAVEQIQNAVEHPSSLASPILYAIVQTPTKFFDEFMFDYMQGTPDNINGQLGIIFLLCLAVVVSSGKKYIFSKKDKIIILVCVIACIAAIWGSMYLAYTEIGARKIAGVQDRYFMPLIFPLIILLYQKQLKFKVKNSTIFYIFSAVELIIIYNALASLFY